MRIVNQKNFATGLLYIAIGAAFAVASSGYRMGTASTMGPGFFPFCLGVLMAVIGAVVLLGALRTDGEPQRLAAWNMRALIAVLASVVLFAFALQWLGLVIAAAGLIAVSSLASREMSWRLAAMSTVALTGFALIVFVYGLKLAIPVWPVFLGG